MQPPLLWPSGPIEKAELRRLILAANFLGFPVVSAVTMDWYSDRHQSNTLFPLHAHCMKMTRLLLHVTEIKCISHRGWS
jgi:hypothetical protein